MNNRIKTIVDAARSYIQTKREDWAIWAGRHFEFWSDGAASPRWAVFIKTPGLPFSACIERRMGAPAWSYEVERGSLVFWAGKVEGSFSVERTAGGAA